MLTDCPTCIHYETCEQSERWDSPACINYKMMQTKNPTNADRIRAMTDEERATVIAWQYLASPPWCSEHTTCPYINEDPTPCDKCAHDWLKQEASK